jgi:hypothetical protein
MAPVLMAALALSACSSGPATDGATDPANEIPFGWIDYPVNNATVGRAVPIAGWAIDDRGVREVRFYVDAHYQTAVQLNTDRPDVSKVYPAYAKRGDRHGWTTSITIDAAGAHTVVVQAVDIDGATRDLGLLVLTVKP